jgi:Ca2+-transporting ATPase
MVAAVYFFSINEGHTEGEVRAIAFSSLIIGNIFLVLTNLSTTRPFTAVFTERNYAAIFILLAAFIVLLLVISVSSLQHVFSFSFPGYRHFIAAIAGSLIVLFILEGIKFFRSRKERID